MGTRNQKQVGAEHHIAPRLVGEILHNSQENSNEQLAVAYRDHLGNAEGRNRNTDFCMDVKTILRKDLNTEVGKDYKGILSRDAVSHYSFVEIADSQARKRNPHVFEGTFLTATRRDDGTYRPNFREVRIENGFNVDIYADNVANEIRMAFKCLVEDS